MKIRDLTGDQVNEGPLGALWKGIKNTDRAVRQVTGRTSDAFAKGYGQGKGAQITTPTDWYKDKNAKDDKDDSDKEVKMASTSKINPELEKVLAKMSPQQQQEILNQIKQGKL